MSIKLSKTNFGLHTFVHIVPPGNQGAKIFLGGAHSVTDCTRFKKLLVDYVCEVTPCGNYILSPLLLARPAERPTICL